MKDVQHLFHINTSFETVYKALSTTNGIASWWTPETTGDCEVGGIITLKFGAMAEMQMKVIDAQQNHLICWENMTGMPDWIGSKICFKLSSNDNKVRVQFSHDNFTNMEDEHLAAINFTWGRYLVSLRNYCETGKGNPFPE